MMRTRHLVAVVALTAAFATLSMPARQAAAAPAAPTVHGAIRVDQLGYTPHEHKVAVLIATAAVAGAPFRVLDVHGNVVLRGHAGPDRGPWNARYPAVHRLDLTALRVPGTYRIRMSGLVTAVSPPFRIASAVTLFGPRVADAVEFFQAQRDGADVIHGPLHRQPSHLNDSHARLYEWPTYEDPDSDVIVGDALTSLGGTANLTGGWFDAGDFIKFAHTTAYADVLLMAAMRTLGPSAPATLGPEARFGLHWLEKAWDADKSVIYFQVGIGSGNQDGTFNGDHDLWRLPEEDDGLTGAANRYLRVRPAFRSNDPGDQLPPNLAGRMSAAFAMAAQLDAAEHPGRARSELETAADIFSRAKTTGVHPNDIVTALPHAFYPESSWRDDMELAATELALAGQKLGDARRGPWLELAASFASDYIAHESGDDTFNLYDTSALAHSDLIRAVRRSGSAPSFTGLIPALRNDMAQQLQIGIDRAAADPFQAGAIYSDFDAAPHTFGLVSTALLYAKRSGDHSFDRFATRQRDWALGANAWGVSLMVGVGTNFPRCMQHVVANLSGSVDGTPPIVRGAVVNGPNDKALFADGLGEFFDEGVACPANGKDRYAKFTAHGSRFVDDVRSWQTVEPAIDFTAAAALAFALLR